MVILHETGRIPVETHTGTNEFGMIEEARAFEHSGPYFALLKWGSELKQLILFTILANVFLAPWGLASTRRPGAVILAIAALLAKACAVGVVVAVIDNSFARLRLFKITEFVSGAFLLAVLGVFTLYLEGGRAAVLVLSAACLGIAAVTPLEIRVIAAGLSPAVPSSLTMGALKSPWILQPVFEGFSILSPSWLWVEMPLMLLLTVLFAWAVSGRRLLRVRRVPAWRSATTGVEGADSYTAFGYANPTRRVLAGVLHTRAELREVMMEDNGGDDGSGPPDRADPGWEEAAAHLRYASDVIEVVETYVYRPALGYFMAVVTAAKRLQSGRLDAYLPALHAHRPGRGHCRGDRAGVILRREMPGVGARAPSPLRSGSGLVRWCRSARTAWSTGRCHRAAGRPSTRGAA